MPDIQATPVRRGRPRVHGLAEQRREEILAEATRHFSARGYHHTDLQELANALGLGKGTVYRYFPRKEQLFLAAVRRVLVLMRAEIDEAIAATDDGLEKIARAIVAYLRFFDRHPQFVELLVLERSVVGDKRKPSYFEDREANASRWKSVFARLMSAGRIRRMPVDAIRNVIGSTVYGTMFTNFFAGRRQTLESQAAQIIEVVFSGILTDAERRATGRSFDRIRTKGGAA